MPKRQKLKKEDTDKIIITQSLWVDTITLTFDKVVCISCDLCHQVCPKEAISLKVQEERIVPDVDEEKCSLCSLCVAFCPVNAIVMRSRNTWKGTEEEIRPILDVGGIPHFSKGMQLNTELCPPGCDLCVKACPREALSLDKSGLKLDRLKCLSCAHCEEACPVKGAIKVTRLFEGNIQVDLDKCPPGCDLCVKACPTHCYTALPGKGVKVDPRHCICCGACYVACPHQAIDLTRLRLRSAEDGYSAVWSRAIDRLLEEHARFINHNETNIIKLMDLLHKSKL